MVLFFFFYGDFNHQWHNQSWLNQWLNQWLMFFLPFCLDDFTNGDPTNENQWWLETINDIWDDLTNGDWKGDFWCHGDWKGDWKPSFTKKHEWWFHGIVDGTTWGMVIWQLEWENWGMVEYQHGGVQEELDLVYEIFLVRLGYNGFFKAPNFGGKLTVWFEICFWDYNLWWLILVPQFGS